MDLIEKTFALRATPIFASVDLDLILSFADQLEEQNFSEGEMLFRKGTLDTNSYLLVKGCVSCWGEGWSTHIEGPYFFGEEGAFNPGKRNYTARCTEPTTCLVMYQSVFHRAMINCPEISIRIIERLFTSNPICHLSGNQAILT